MTPRALPSNRERRDGVRASGQLGRVGDSAPAAAPAAQIPHLPGGGRA